MGAATSATDFFDSSTTAGARGALFTKDLEVVGVVAIITTGVNKMLEGGPADFYRVVHDIA